MELEAQEKHSSELLGTFQNVVLSKFPQLVLRTESVCDGDYFLKIEQNNAQPSAVKYVREFLVVAEPTQSDQEIELKLLTFAGKTVRTEILNFMIPDISSKVLTAWNGNEIRMCQGVNEDKVLSNVIEEHFGNSLVRRARTCHYELMDQASETQCEACRSAECDEDTGAWEDLENFKTELKIKGEPEDEDDSWVPYDGEFPDPEIYLDDNEYVESTQGRDKGKKGQSISNSASDDDDYIPPNLKSSRKRTDNSNLSENLSEEETVKPKKRGRGRPRTNKWMYASSDEEGNPKRRKKEDMKVPCSNCKETFRSRFLAKKHEAFCLQGLHIPDLVISECPVCLKNIKSAKKFKTHMQFHESRSELDTAVNCPQCGMMLESKYKLNPHYQEAHGKDRGCCIECLKEIEAPLLWKHVYAHFLSQKNKLCTTCGKSFATRAALKAHHSFVHDDTEGNQVICDECGKLVHKVKLSDHKSKNHNNTKRFRCNVCGKEFRTPMLYYKHKTIHSAVKPWACDICKYRSVRKDNVLLHLRKRHPLSDPKSHVIKVGEHVYDARLDQAQKEKLHIVTIDQPRTKPVVQQEAPLFP